MERGTRILTCLQSLEKLTVSGQKSALKFGPEDLQQLRGLTSKILQHLQTQDKCQRDLVIKNSAYVDLILNVLENTSDSCTLQNLLLVILELIGKSQTSKRIATLVSHGATQILFHILVLEAKEDNFSDDVLFIIHQVLAKIGHKDRKFGVKARLSQALGVTLGLVRTFIASPKLLQPVVHVLKLYAANAVNASYLGKNGAVSYLFRILSVAGRKHLSLSKYTFEALALLVKSKSNAARAIGQGGVPTLLSASYDWHRIDTKNRHIALRKAILSVLKNITNLQSGRKALMDADGIRVLYTTCQESVDSREVESLIYMASLIMRKCFPKNRLPLNSLRSPITCRLPQSDFHVPDCGEGQDGCFPPNDEKPCIFGVDNRVCGDENGYESSVDNDDDVSSDDDPDPTKQESDEDGTLSSSKVPYKRTQEDLNMYKKFFPELYEFDIILDEDAKMDVAATSTIIIPTASAEQSNQECLPKHTLRYTTSQSVPSLAQKDIGTSTLEKYNSDWSQKRNVDFESDLFRNNVRPRSQQREYAAESMFDASTVSHGASAVNLKTGASVFSLDFPSAMHVAKPIPPIPPIRSPRSKRKTPKVIKSKRRLKKEDDDWCTFDPLQSLLVAPFSRDTNADDDGLDDDDEALNDEDIRFITTRYDNPELYADIATNTKSVGRFSKLAYPDMYGHIPPPYKEPLYEKRFGMQRQKIFEDIDRFINPDQTIDRTVYDLDSIVSLAGHTYSGAYSNFTNRDEIRVAQLDESIEHLKFNSQFECGNLRKAIQIRKYEYDLILNPDTNTNHHHQWFYFEVSNMEAGVKYRFNIVNNEKLNSQFNFGMKPVMFSVAEAMQGRPHWVRTGSEICYYKNHFVRSTQTTGGIKGKTYYTTTFTLTFKHEKDVCYLAYHYPYSYSMLQYHLHKLEESYDSSVIYYRNDSLCQTIGGNSVPLLTITSHPPSYDKEGIEAMKNRPYIFLSARVHPGESNSSWVMKGTISYLLSNKASAISLREQYIFKVVPMLNPDGVINGTHRCSLVAEDLNRRWLYPCPKLHPTIYHTKGLLQYLSMINKTPMVFCDYHGHSRKKNVFLYGCSPNQSWMTEDMSNSAFLINKMEDSSYKTLPKVLANSAPSFSLANCSFVVEKVKESTARVVVWRQLGIIRSYTMESSYCGCDQGPYKGYHMSTRELEEMGRKFAESLLKIKSRHQKPPQSCALMDGAEGDLFLGGTNIIQEMADLQILANQRTEELGHYDRHGLNSDATPIEHRRFSDTTQIDRPQQLSDASPLERPSRLNDLTQLRRYRSEESGQNGSPDLLQLDKSRKTIEDLIRVERPRSKQSVTEQDLAEILASNFGDPGASNDLEAHHVATYQHSSTTSSESDLCEIGDGSGVDDEIDDDDDDVARVEVSDSESPPHN